MKEIIAIHGWGSNRDIWEKWNEHFPEESYLWQKYERGYYGEKQFIPRWFNNSSEEKILICHSLGLHFCEPQMLSNASIIVLINSFTNFLGLNNKSSLLAKSTRMMKNEIKDGNAENVILKFFTKGFRPNKISHELNNFMKNKFLTLNIDRLINDLDILINCQDLPTGFPKPAKIILIRSNNDFILNNDSQDILYNDIIKNKNKINKILTEYNGHFILNLNFINDLKKLINSK